MIPLQSLLDTALFRLEGLTGPEMFDLLLVTITFYLLLNFMQRSQAALLLRGALILSGLLFIVTIILPLPTFDWVLRGAILAVLIVTPVIFQPELRRILERIGRSVGMTRDVRSTAVEQTFPKIVRAVENMAASHTGALIAVEGEASLREVIETGVSINGKVTSELLQAIFYPSNPLHDGAVVLREEEVVAAGCVLPVTQRPLYAQRRLGTRHRAAAGLSESSDALIIVVSEETGQISVAYLGELHRPLDIAALRKHLLDFYAPAEANASTLSLWGVVKQGLVSIWRWPSLPTTRQLLMNVGLLFISMVLALATWTFVNQRTNPATRLRYENISLQVRETPPNTTLMSSPPDTVAAVVQTTSSMRPTLSSASFQASVSLVGLEPGLHNVPVKVAPAVSRVRVLAVDPPALDLELAPIVTKTMRVTIRLSDRENLSRAYQVVGTPVALPSRVTVIGAEPKVNQVNTVEATVSLANVSASLQEVHSLQALDEAGREVRGVTLEPAQAQVSVVIQRRINARDVGVRVITAGKPAAGYWVKSLTVSPANVTLQGDPEQLTDIGSFISTLPVDIENARGNISIQVPLDLPASVQAVDNEGNTAKTVTVQVEIEARDGNLVVTRPVELIGLTAGITATVSPESVRLLLNGPLPTLNEIETNPELVQVTADVTGLEPEQMTSVQVAILAPGVIEAQSSPPEVTVSLH